MATYKKTKNLLPEVAAYIAGLIDGEKLTPRNGKYNDAIKINLASFEAEFLALCSRQTLSGSAHQRQIVPINATWVKRMQKLVKDVKVDLNARLEPDDD